MRQTIRNSRKETFVIRDNLKITFSILKIIQEDLKAEILIDMEIKEESRFQRLQ